MTRSSSRPFIVALLLAFVVTLASGATRSACAAELLMFELKGCPWCKLWHAEIGPAYPHSPEGRRAPLRIVDVKGPSPEEIIFDTPIRSSPTFVLVDNGREIGRITGYPGAEFFWSLLDELLAKLAPQPVAPPAHAPPARVPGQRAL